MSDEPTTPAIDPFLNHTGRAIVAFMTIAFSMWIIVWTLFYGNPNNSLHQSALSWGFTLLAIVVVGIGAGAAIPGLLKRP